MYRVLNEEILFTVTKYYVVEASVIMIKQWVAYLKIQI